MDRTGGNITAPVAVIAAVGIAIVFWLTWLGIVRYRNDRRIDSFRPLKDQGFAPAEGIWAYPDSGWAVPEGAAFDWIRGIFTEIATIEPFASSSGVGLFNVWVRNSAMGRELLFDCLVHCRGRRQCVSKTIVLLRLHNGMVRPFVADRLLDGLTAYHALERLVKGGSV